MKELNETDTLELLKRIEEYKNMDLKNTTLEEISLKTLETLNCMIVSGCEFTRGQRLYRVRKVDGDYKDKIKTFQDIWHPPAQLVKKDGRVNLKGNPILYCSTDKNTPIYECNIKEGDCYAIIQYSIKENEKIMGYMVGNQEESTELNERGKINNKIINDFITSEFSKPVGEGTEYLYKISNVIAMNFMDLPFCDAYVYPSVEYYRKGWNVAIKPESAIKKINFDCVCICVLKEFTKDGGYKFELKHKANIIENGKLVYQF